MAEKSSAQMTYLVTGGVLDFQHYLEHPTTQHIA